MNENEKIADCKLLMINESTGAESIFKISYDNLIEGQMYENKYFDNFPDFKPRVVFEE